VRLLPSLALDRQEPLPPGTNHSAARLKTQGRRRSKILGGFSYTTTAGKLALRFVTTDSSVFAYFGEVCYTGDPFETIIEETRDGSTTILKRGSGETLPYVSIRED